MTFHMLFLHIVCITTRIIYNNINIDYFINFKHSSRSNNYDYDKDVSNKKITKSKEISISMKKLKKNKKATSSSIYQSSDDELEKSKYSDDEGGETELKHMRTNNSSEY